MFIKSAASDTSQGKAIQSSNEKWGGSAGRTWNGRETIGVQVCKKKYTPFLFSIETTDDGENDAKNSNAITNANTSGTTTCIPCANGRRKKTIKVVRMFGCPHHSNFRKEKIENYGGVRKGWEPFGQWSIRKAHQLARRETNRLNNNTNEHNNNSSKQHGDKSSSNVGKNVVSNNLSDNEEIKTICHNGKCTWKMKEKYDNVYNEITGYDSSSEEDT